MTSLWRCFCKTPAAINNLFEAKKVADRQGFEPAKQRKALFAFFYTPGFTSTSMPKVSKDKHLGKGGGQTGIRTLEGL